MPGSRPNWWSIRSCRPTDWLCVYLVISSHYLLFLRLRVLHFDAGLSHFPLEFIVRHYCVR